VALPRVYDLAKELGIDTKVALSKLEELGEYVKGGSSTCLLYTSDAADEGCAV
jgi:translation initiation factor IF-2